MSESQLQTMTAAGAVKALAPSDGSGADYALVLLVHSHPTGFQLDLQEHGRDGLDARTKELFQTTTRLTAHNVHALVTKLGGHAGPPPASEPTEGEPS